MKVTLKQSNDERRYCFCNVVAEDVIGFNDDETYHCVIRFNKNVGRLEFGEEYANQAEPHWKYFQCVDDLVDYLDTLDLNVEDGVFVGYRMRSLQKIKFVEFEDNEAFNVYDD